MDKSLKDKAIDFKGKKYVLVADRINYFNEAYKNGYIQTILVSKPEDDRIIVKAKVVPDVATPDRYFTGYSQAVVGEGYINKTSALENCETSAVGRALALLGIGIIESVASLDEINKASTRNYWIDKKNKEKEAQKQVKQMDIEADNEKDLDNKKAPF